MKKTVSVKPSAGAKERPSSSADAAVPKLTKNRWQLIAAAILWLLWLGELAWLAAGH